MKLNIFALVAIAGISIGSASASAENFVVEGSNNGVNKALNTNNNFSKIDGNPRMSLWDANPNDPDQQFDRMQGSLNGTLLKHRSTGKCLNAYYVKNGGVVTTWPCDTRDAAQNFNITDAGGGYLQIRRTGTNFCVDSPTRDNGGKIHVWQCVNNANQRWRNLAQSDRLTRINQVLAQLNGAYSITDPNGNYPGQCVSFVKRFTQGLGILMNPMGGNGGARYGFINYNVAGLSLTANQADKIVFNGSQQPQVGDIIFFDQTSKNAYGHIAVVQSVLGNGRVIIQESNANANAPNTSVTQGEINLNSNPPRAGYGSVLGWLRLKI